MWDLITGSFSRLAITGQDGRLTIPSLPAGTYEFWPYRTLEELGDLFRTVYTKEPTRVVVNPGPNNVAIALDRAQ